MIIIQENNKSDRRVNHINDLFNIKSFCSVVTTEVKREAHVLVTSINKFYSCPIVFFCDKETMVYFSNFRIANLILIVIDFKKPDKVLELNDYHKTDAISRKMDVMEFCIKRYSNTLFLDCDIILLSPLIGPRFCDVALSLNLSINSDCVYEYVKRDGLFNAGMVWSSSVDFVRWWKDKYTSGDSLFYEQECLNKVYKTGHIVEYFDNNHNHGFWRGCNILSKHILSIHCHLDIEFIKAVKDKWMLDSLHDFRSASLGYIKKHHTDLYLEIVNILL